MVFDRDPGRPAGLKVVQVFAYDKQELIDTTCALNVRKVLILSARRLSSTMSPVDGSILT